jgi:uncharacterized iron-regulated membrane protein
MLSSSALRAWSWVHKWSSVVCTLFMLLLCITGLPLIFHHEIDHLTGNEVQAPPLPASTANASLDRILASANARYPDRIVQFASQLADAPRLWFVTLTPTPQPTEDFKSIAVDERTAIVIAEPPTDGGFMHVLFRLHVDLFAGLPGKLFLGLMGVLLLIAVGSGVVLYAPFMRRLRFGDVRRGRSRRLNWLDLHNLLGITTVVWVLVVGATGVINTWADLLFKLWQFEQMGELIAPYRDQGIVPPSERASVQRAMDVALREAPETRVRFIAFPGTAFSSPRHYTFFLRGDEPLTSHLYQTVMVDASTSQVTGAPALPWYLTALLISRPLHFGDYGGMPMKIIWALLDLATIIVLGSGLYLWLGGRERRTETAADPQGLRRTGGAYARAQGRGGR